MNTASRLSAYAVGLMAVLGAATGLGKAIGPLERVTEPAAMAGGHVDHAPAAEDAEPADHMPGGLMVSQDGYTLALTDGSLSPGAATPISFRVLGPDGHPVTGFEPTHDKDLHLIVVRRDLTGFQHVHPEFSVDGTWGTRVALTPGEWRIFADFAPSGHDEAMILGTDLSIAGRYQPVPLPAPATTAEVDGYTVTLDGTLQAGHEALLTLSVSRHGQPVTDLQPYLGAYGHLVALRDGDLAYLHVHPEPGRGLTFRTTAPSAAAYRLFLDFRHEGVVRTAEFTVRAGTQP